MKRLEKIFVTRQKTFEIVSRMTTRKTERIVKN